VPFPHGQHCVEPLVLFGTRFETLLNLATAQKLRIKTQFPVDATMEALFREAAIPAG